MSRKHFSLLFFITFLVAALVLLLPGKTGRESSFEQSDFLPELAGQANDIDWVRLTGASGVTIATLARVNDGWTVEEASGYRADWDQLKSLLAGLARARVIEMKTDNPEFYDRLGVQDISAADAAGIQVEFAEGSGVPTVIVGNNAKARSGQYARLRDSVASVLVDSQLSFPKTTPGWLDTDIIDITDSEVVEYQVRHPDGTVIKAVKASADDGDFELQDIPDGREIKSAWNVNSPANALAALTLDEVVPSADLNWDESVQYQVLTADGLTIEAKLITVETSAEEAGDPEHWLRLRAGIYTTSLENTADSEVDRDATRARAEDINARVDGWAYRIPRYKYDPMTRNTEDLLKPTDVE